MNSDNDAGISENDTSTCLLVYPLNFFSAGEENSGRDNSLQLSSSPSTMAPQLLRTIPESDTTSLLSESNGASLDTGDLVPDNNVEKSQ